MKRIGLVTIGETPRVDLVPEISHFLPKAITIVEAGALDGLSPMEIEAQRPVTPDRTLVSRLANGTEARIDKDFVHERLQRAIRCLETKVDLIGLLCSGAFSDLVCSVPLLIPYRLLRGYLSALSLPGRWGVLVPSSDQVEPTLVEFEEWGIKAVGKAVSPYSESHRLEETVCALTKSGVSAILLDCFGYTLSMRTTVQTLSQRPVISVRSLFARALVELVG